MDIKIRSISIKMHEDILQHLRQLARVQSVEQHKDITYSDLLREAVLKTFPMDKENEKKNN